ncbi:MAG: DNA polymerase III delta subunit [Candidatus Scalindua rubra]|uniref:DNA polymerase III subunit delta n=1 Tax=Candidatus Scalindua rubra TaxID=1872076 RepID=A0A1E3X3Z9_9BACT|nr:MAG: DNA polymerase III delta subunit [Candidatus Scalindua rubra]
MKFTEFTHKFKGKGKFSLYIISGNEYFLKKQALTEIKKHFFLEGGTEQGFIKFDNKDTGTNFLSEEIEKNSAKNARSSTLLFNDIFDEIRTAPMFGKHKLIMVENADNFLNKYQDKLLEYIKGSFDVNYLVLEVSTIDKRTRLAKTLDSKHGILVECDKLYDSPAPWETNKPEYDSELTRWIVMHVKNYNKIMNLKSAFYLMEKTGNNLAIIDKQIDALSIYVGDRKEITIEDIQTLLGLSHREKLYNLLDAIGMKDTISAIRISKNIFDVGMENERKNITYDAKSIAITMITSIHRRMKDLWKVLRILDKGGGKKDILERTSVKRPFIDKFSKQALNFIEKEMPDKWKYMLEADLLCKTSRLSPILIIEQLITKLCT